MRGRGSVRRCGCGVRGCVCRWVGGCARARACGVYVCVREREREREGGRERPRRSDQYAPTKGSGAHATTCNFGDSDASSRTDCVHPRYCPRRAHLEQLGKAALVARVESLEAPPAEGEAPRAPNGNSVRGPRQVVELRASEGGEGGVGTGRAGDARRITIQGRERKERERIR